MLGSRKPQLQINATAITYHNVNLRHVVPPQSGQLGCEYKLSFVPYNNIFSAPDLHDQSTLIQRSQQIAAFIMVLYDPDRPTPSPGSITFLRPQSMIPTRSQAFGRLKGMIKRILDEAMSICPSELDDKVRYEWISTVAFPEHDLGDCDVCGGECW